MVIPKGNPTDKEYTFEFTINKKGGGSEFAELYGPYKVSKEGLILAQEFIYNYRDFKGKYIAALKLYSNGNLIDENRYDVNFNTGTLIETTENVASISFGKIMFSYSMILLLILMTITVPSFYIWNFKREIEETISEPHTTETIQEEYKPIIDKKGLSIKEGLRHELESINKNINELRISATPDNLQIINTTEKEKGKIKSSLDKKNVKETVLDKKLSLLNRTLHGYPKSRLFKKSKNSDYLKEIDQKIKNVKIPIKRFNVKTVSPSTAGHSRILNEELNKKKNWITNILNKGNNGYSKDIEKTKKESIIDNKILEIDQEIAKLDKIKFKKVKFRSVISTKGRTNSFRKKDLEKEQNKIIRILTRSKKKSKRFEVEKSEELKKIEEEIAKLRKKQNGNKN